MSDQSPMNSNPDHDARATNQDVRPDASASEMSPQASAHTADESVPEAPIQGLADELRRLGELLAGSARAAANTEEAQALRQEIRDGVEAMRKEIDGAVGSTRQTTTRVGKEYRSAGVSRLRSDLANALRAVNRAVDGLAANLEGSAQQADGSEDHVGGPGSGSDDGGSA